MENISLSDEELVLKIQDDDSLAFATLYERYWTPLWRFAYNSMKEEDDAKDIVQDVFLSLWTKRNTIRIHTSVSSFLYRMTINRVINNVGKSKVADKYIESIKTRYKEGETTTENTIYERELRRCFEEGLSQIPRKARQAFELSRKFDMSHQQISEHLSVSKETVKSHIKASLKVLRKSMTMLLSCFF